MFGLSHFFFSSDSVNWREQIAVHKGLRFMVILRFFSLIFRDGRLKKKKGSDVRYWNIRQTQGFIFHFTQVFFILCPFSCEFERAVDLSEAKHEKYLHRFGCVTNVTLLKEQHLEIFLLLNDRLNYFCPQEKDRRLIHYFMSGNLQRKDTKKKREKN